MKQEKTGQDPFVKGYILTKNNRIVSPDRHKKRVRKLYSNKLLPHDGTRSKYTRTAVKWSLEYSAEINSKKITSHFKFSLKVKKTTFPNLRIFMYSCNRLNLRYCLDNILLSFPFLQAFVQILNLFLHIKTRLSSTRIVLFPGKFPLIGSI